MRVIAFEGLPYTGKTSVANRLALVLESTAIVPDYHDCADEFERQWLATQPVDEADERRRINRYIELERVRWDHVTDESRVVLVDRSYLSVLAYAAACQLQGLETFDLGPYEQKFRSLAEDPFHPLCSLDVALFISIPAATAARRARRGGRKLPSPMMQAPFLRHLEVAYSTVLNTAACPVDMIDGRTESLEETFGHVERVLLGRGP